MLRHSLGESRGRRRARGGGRCRHRDRAAHRRPGRNGIAPTRSPTFLLERIGATAGVAGMSAPIVLYDTTLRDGTQREGLVLSLADKLKIARRLDEAGFPYIEGGWPGSNPKDEEFFAAAEGMTFRHARTRRVRIDPASLQPGGRRPEHPRPARRRDAGDDDLRQELAAARDRRARRHARGEPRDDRRLGGPSRAPPVARSIYDAEHFFDGYKADAAYALATLRAAIDAGATTVVLCDTNGGCLTDEVAAMTRSVATEVGGPRADHRHPRSR